VRIVFRVEDSDGGIIVPEGAVEIEMGPDPSRHLTIGALAGETLSDAIGALRSRGDVAIEQIREVMDSQRVVEEALAGAALIITGTVRLRLQEWARQQRQS
jgi:hypothetical protein